MKRNMEENEGEIKAKRQKVSMEEMDLDGKSLNIKFFTIESFQN